MKNENNLKISFDLKNILTVLSLIVFGYLVFLVKDILILILCCWIISVLLSPFVDQLEKYKIPRIISAPLIVIGIISILIYIGYLSMPEIISQYQALTINYSQRTRELFDSVFISGIAENELRNIESTVIERLSDFAVLLSSKAFDITVTILDYIINIFISIFLIIFFVIDKDFVKRSIEFISEKNVLAMTIYQRSEEKLKVWLRGQIISMVLVGFISYISLLLLRVEYALPLGILAGLFEIVPFIGPNLAALPAVLLGFGVSPVKGLTIVIVYFLIQQIQASVLVPKIMNDTVGLNPIIVIFSILIGARLLWPVGTIIAVPFVATLIIIIEEFRDYKNKTVLVDDVRVGKKE
jgi:predicted PurR-regulated permease PerM